MSSLLPHEETIPARVTELVAEMTQDGVQKDPIIIDRETSTVLDGMHRLAAFKELREENAVCCSVDYSTRAITIGRWARVYEMRGGSSVADALRGIGEVRRVTLAQSFVSLQNRDSALALLTRDSAYLHGGKDGEEEVRTAFSFLDRLSEEEGWQRRFVPEDEIDVELQGSRKLVVLPRRLTKDDVVSAARSGRLFPCKTSMHVIDPRPVAVRFPLTELKSATTATLRERFGARGGRIGPSGSMYEGRRYKERLLFLDED